MIFWTRVIVSWMHITSWNNNKMERKTSHDHNLGVKTHQFFSEAVKGGICQKIIIVSEKYLGRCNCLPSYINWSKGGDYVLHFENICLPSEISIHGLLTWACKINLQKSSHCFGNGTITSLGRASMFRTYNDHIPAASDSWTTTMTTY
jgi:hypothetical protein